MWFGNETLKYSADLAKIAVRSTDNFNWTFIALLAFVDRKSVCRERV